MSTPSVEAKKVIFKNCLKAEKSNDSKLAMREMFF
jgi:hypothetical protein